MASTKPKRVSFSLDNRSPRPATRAGTSRLRCFNGLTRRTSDWDGWKRDLQLWFPDGNCMVYFSAQGNGSQTPSLNLPFKAVEALECAYLFKHHLHTRDYFTSSEDSQDDSGYSSSPSESSAKTAWELHIPAPTYLTREGVFKYHLATRNLFAYAVSRPIVGERLSAALLDVWQRIQEWKVGADPLLGMTNYLNSQGYLDLSDTPEHALACLKLAEKAESHEIWVNAFAHCVGMHDRLDLSPEFAGLSKRAGANITCASLEMDIVLSRKLHSLGGFLEDELGTEHLGLPRVARDHLDRFRSFLHSFYVDKLGYYPPSKESRWSRRLWSGVQRDFQCLYDYLVDSESDFDLATTRRLDGGICTLQNLKAFDTRHGYASLPHPLPLLPESVVNRQHHSSSTKSRPTFRRTRSSLFHENEHDPRYALERASNRCAEEVMSCGLVHEYQWFERQKMVDKLSISEARKVRWILIYCTLQMLNSMIQAPDGVKDVRSSSYPMCIPPKRLSRWLDEAVGPRRTAETLIESPRVLTPPSTTLADDTTYPEGRTSRISIHPDCEAETADDFFASIGGGLSRRTSQPQLDNNLSRSSTLRARMQLTRTNSLRSSMHSSVTSLHRSFVGSLSRRNSLRRHSLQPDMLNSNTCESVREDGVFELDSLSNESPTPDSLASTAGGEDRSALAEFDFDLGTTTAKSMLENHQSVNEAMENREPVLESHQLDFDSNATDEYLYDHGHRTPALPLDSRPQYRDSAYFDSYESSPRIDPIDEYDVSSSSDFSYWEQKNNTKRSSNASYSSQLDRTDSSDMGEFFISETRQYGGPPSQRTKRTSLHAGCYIPSGMTSASTPATRTPVQRKISAGSDGSVYPDEPQQADEIEEEETRGRQKSRAMDEFIHYHRRPAFIGQTR